MKDKAIPFRNYLKRRSKRGRSKSEWYRDLQRLLAREYREDEAFLMKIINHEDELLPWLLIEQEKATWRHLDPDAPGSSVIQHLMERATKDLSNEPGIWWTPLIDALADLGAWNRTGYRLKSIPDDLELRRPIRIWLKKASSAGLDQWLVFKSLAARKDAIEYSATLTWKQLDELTNDPALVKEVSRNWELCERYWRRLVEKGWRIYQEQAQNRDDLRAHHIQMTWLSLFHGFTLTQHKLPAHIRRGLVEEAENSEKTNQHASEPKRNLIVALLADDQGLTKREFKRLMALDPEEDAIVPML